MPVVPSPIPRRSILVAAGAAGIGCLPKVGLAQPKQRIYRVGVLAVPADTVFWNEFVAELSRLGYREGTNVVFVRRAPVDRQVPLDIDRLAGALVQADVDVIYTQGGPTALAAKNAAESTADDPYTGY